jgi:8-oxo-dGTP pyrophosphatase MutT (NUDIX family)
MEMPGPIRVENSAGGVVIRDLDGVTHALVIRDPYRNWGLPKGHLEEGEGPAEAALREVAEETGLTDLRLGAELVTIDWRFKAQGSQIHKFTTFYLMFSEAGEPVPQSAEGITECIWVPLGDADEKITYENASDVMRIAQQAIANDSLQSEADHGR